MNPSYMPVSDGLWGVTSKAIAALDPVVSSNNLTQHDLKESFDCHSCGKHYTRACDLNQHLKTHSRPFKCPVDECRYHIFGWPTEKELERHYNDKHSQEPRVFSCLWHDCSYTSKRESNCKQHMEKAHGYNYIRSRAGNMDESPFSGPIGQDNHDLVYPRNKLAIQTVPNVLLTPSTLDHCYSATAGPASPLNLTGPIPFRSPAHIPWNSPSMNLRSHDLFLDELSQSCSPGTPATLQDNDWLRVPVDPRLYASSSSGCNTPDESPVAQLSGNRDELFRALPVIITPKTSPTVTSQVLTPVSESSPRLVQASDSRREATNPPSSNPHQQAVTFGLGLSQPGGVNPHGKRNVRFAKARGEESDGDDEPPVKRPRAPESMEDDIGDPKMICPFRKAHPEIYDLDVHSKYYSCHTEHHNISTVVRHLGRPAHNLEVDNSRQAISSFDVADNEHGHPAAGLCKKCWRAFTDRDAFDNHFLTKCEAVSRSKREKFQILLKTFCGTPDDESNLSDSHSGASDVEDTEDDAVVKDKDFVRRGEYLALVNRVSALERMLATRPSRPTQTAGQRMLPGQHTSMAAARAFTSSPALPSQAYGGYYSLGSDPDQGPSRATRSSGSGAGAAGGESTTVIVSSIDPQPAHGGGAQTAGGFYGDAEHMMPGFGGIVSRQPDSLSTMGRESPLTVVPGGGSSSVAAATAVAAQQRPRTIPDTGYRSDAPAPASSRGPSALSSQPHSQSYPPLHHQPHLATHHQQDQRHVGTFASAPGSSGHVDRSSSSQQATSAMMRERWDQPVEVDEAMMDRMDFFNNQSSGDDISKFLNMDSQ